MAYETDERWNVFLRELCRLPSKSDALKNAKITQSEYLARCEDDADFVSAVTSARSAGIEALEDVAIQRAVLGVDEPIYWQGTVVGFKTVYSDRLLTFLLQGNVEKYRGEGEKATNLSDEARGTIAEVFASLQAEYEGKKTDITKILSKKGKAGRPSLFRQALSEIGTTEDQAGEKKHLFGMPATYTFAAPPEETEDAEFIDVEKAETTDEQAKDLGIKPKGSAKLKSRRK